MSNQQPNKLSALAIIPARGGSKSIPRKNIKQLGGIPLIAYSVAAALEAGLVDRVIVSTDDAEIAAVAREYGAETPFLRPDQHAQDDTADLPVFQHALEWLAEQEGYRPDIVVQLRPTSPFRPLGMVDAAVQILHDRPDASSVRGIVPAGENPYKMWRDPGQGPMQPLLDSDIQEAYNQPRQKLPSTYWQTGHIDAIRSQAILTGSMSGPTIYPLHIDPVYLVDLDTALDWERAVWRLKDPEMIIIRPEGADERQLPSPPALLVFDFDGVMTDNRVYVDQNGVETVAAHRGDGMGIELLRRAGVPMMVLSTESNPVVAARCQKLKLDYLHGIGRKGEALTRIIEERQLDPAEVIYVGNDVNDLSCFAVAGTAVAVADAHPEALAAADLILTKKGGHGAVRELCDQILAGFDGGGGSSWE
jgi:N-acylneuraminate cytidylyltransferase